ncbi:hypothetical protein [Burkholderia phage vB_BglM_WTB]
MAIYENKLLKGVKSSIIEADGKGRLWFSLDNTRTGVVVAIDTTVADLREFANRLLSNCDAIEQKPSKLGRGKVGNGCQGRKIAPKVSKQGAFELAPRAEGKGGTQDPDD